jgi:hypothetical protein
MKRLELIGVIFSLVIFVTTACGSDEPERKSNEPKAVSKTNSTRVYMHYMPWFQSKDVSGYWGSHWTMKNKNPETILDNGQREIASHYYPLIGPYDSKDLDVIQYHLLLMKYAGVDGVLIDWYGSHNVYDYRPNLSGANALIDNIDDVGLQFGIVYEEFTAESVDQQTSKTALQAAQVDVILLLVTGIHRDRFKTPASDFRAALFQTRISMGIDFQRFGGETDIPAVVESFRVYRSYR